MGVTCNDGDFVRIVASQMGVYEDEEVCDCG